MNYQEHYNRLIKRAKEREITTYTESHHIIPRCIGGTDEKENLVRLTGREHFIAHLLLSKMYPEEDGLILAIQMMTVNSNSHLNERINNRMYSWLKEKHAKAMSILQSGEKNSQFGTMWIHNLELKENKKIKKDEFPFFEQDGWLKGRILNFENKCRCCAYCNNIIHSGKFCSKKCKTYFRSPNYKKIDDNIEILVEEFTKNRSIEKTLKIIDLYNKVGNTYLSSILKSKGFSVLKRRNTLD